MQMTPWGNLGNAVHEEFCKDLNGMPLPCDDTERENFEQDVFILGDPAASFDRSSGHSYDRKSSNPHAGFPEWKKTFSYILRDCGYLVDYDTVCVLVDTRDLADHAARDPGLPHWQAAVAWWESRLQMTGPMGERTELCFFPASELLDHTMYIPRGRAPLSLLISGQTLLPVG